MGHEVVSRQSSVVSRNRLEVARPGTSDAFWPVTGDRGLGASPGRVLGLVGPAGSGLTTLGVTALSQATVSEPVAVLDVRGWFCPSFAWTAGIEPERLVIVRCSDPEVWPKLAATLVEGFPAVYAEVPRRIPDRDLRRLGAIVRTRGTSAVLRAMEGDLPTGLLHARVEGVAVNWEGTEAGHGRLQRRSVMVRVSGKGAQGMERMLEVEDDGANPVRLVPRLAAPAARRASG